MSSDRPIANSQNPIDKKNHFQFYLYLGLSLGFAAAYGSAALHQAFRHPYLVSDDARQHVFWMQCFIDPTLFPNDLIADYFQSIAPAGYTAFYRLFASLGIEPLLLSKILPIGLGILASGYCFCLTLELFPLPAAGWMATLLFNQNLWMRDDLASGTPRAFLPPLFLAVLYYLVRRSLFPCLASLILLGLFYPQAVLIAAGVLLLFPWHWQRFTPHLDRPYIRVAIAGLIVAFLVLLPYALQTSGFDPTIAASQAKMMPEFFRGGRAEFFSDDFGRYWLSGGRSGIQPALDPPLLCLGLLLPILMQFPDRFPLVRQIRSPIRLLPQLAIVGLGLFFAAHAVLFKLHLPSRYTQHSLRVVMALAAAIALVLILDALWRQIHRPIALFISLLAIAYLILYPASLKNFPKTSYSIGNAPHLYQFFARQPADIVIASLADEANNLPTFAHRSILVGQEYAIPYHLGYYRPFRKKAIALIDAQYTPNVTELRQFIQTYGIDFWLLEPNAFTADYIARHRWLRQYPDTRDRVLKQLQAGQIPALSQRLTTCPTQAIDGAIVVSTVCLLNR
jgi:hypothetical protein